MLCCGNRRKKKWWFRAIRRQLRQGHEQYEELCALAAGGQLSEQEYSELSEHLRGCSHCNQLHSQFAGVLETRLPFAAATTRNAIASWGIKDTGYLNRFIERARSEGIEVPRDEHKRLGFAAWRWPTLRPSFAVAALALVG